MNSIKRQLKKNQVSSLTQQEKNFIWKEVSLSMSVNPKKTSHKIKTSSIFKKSIAISLIFGMTMGTASAADKAKPGDILFPFDRAIEDVQISIASSEKKDELKVKFALERVDEVKTIFSEISTKSTTKKAEEIKDSTADEIPKATEIAEIKKSEEIKTQVEEAGKVEETIEVDKKTENSEEETKPLEEIGTVSSSTKEEVSQKELTAENSPENNEAKKPIANMSEAEISNKDKQRIEVALGTALDFLGDMKGELSEQGNNEAASSIDNLLKDLNSEIETLPENITFEVKLSPSKQKIKFEITSEDNKEAVQITKTPEEETTESNKPSDDASEKKEIEAPKETKMEIKDGILKINGKAEENKETETIETKTEESKTIEKDQSSSTTTEDVLENTEKKEEVTAVKVILKKLDKKIDFSITDRDESLHKIIEEYTDKKEEV